MAAEAVRLARLELLMQELIDAIYAQRPPDVKIDMAAVVAAIEQIPRPMTAEEIEAILRGAITIPPPQDLRPQFDELKALLEKIAAKPFGGSGNQVVATPGTIRIANGQSIAISNPEDIGAPARPATSTYANVATSTSAATLIASNTARLGGTVYNDSSAVLYVKYGSGAASNSFNVALAPLTSGVAGYMEIPNGYTGIVTGTLASGTGTARVTEFTA